MKFDGGPNAMESNVTPTSPKTDQLSAHEFLTVQRRSFLKLHAFHPVHPSSLESTMTTNPRCLDCETVFKCTANMKKKTFPCGLSQAEPQRLMEEV